jgi:FixJ family two-component response regulator
VSILPAIYVIDDDARVREALTLLLAKSGIPSQPFESAEAFLGALPPPISRSAVWSMYACRK